MTWKCATDRVLVRREERQTVTASGLHLPSQMKEGVIRGIVLASGPNAINVLPGDTALFDTKYARQIEGDVFSINADGILALQRPE